MVQSRCKANLASVSAERPLLAVDVDGVISLFGFEDPLRDVWAPPSGGSPGELKLIDGVPHYISLAAGERLCRLGEHYELVWATGWEERANDHLPTLLGLPCPLPVLTFGGRARFGTAHWKLEAIEEYAGERPLAWIDDCMDESCRAWAASREAPTLLVQTEPDRGLEEAHVEALLAWIREGFEPR
jgi:hypothetical protein